MKQVVIFLALLFPFLMGNYAAHSSPGNNKISYSFAQQNKNGLAINSGFIIKENVAITVDNDYLGSAEDDDDTEDSARKHLSQSRHFATSFYSPTSHNRHSSSLPIRFVSNRQVANSSSCKYLIHRSLRI